MATPWLPILHEAKIRLPFVRCRHCRRDTGQVNWSRRYQYDYAHRLCTPLPPFLPGNDGNGVRSMLGVKPEPADPARLDKRRIYAGDVSDWLKSLLDERQIELWREGAE